MRADRLVRVALGEAGAPLWRSWNLALGIALGVATLVLLVGLARGVETNLRERLLGSLPDRLRVEPAVFQMGPLRLGDSLGEDMVARLKALPGVREVYRQARFPRPAQLHASYAGQEFWSDVLLEGVDPGLVEAQLPRGQSFASREDGRIPAVLPRVMLDVLSAGVSIHTHLPSLSPDMLIGREFTLVLGRSSFSGTVGPVAQYRCVLVGISDQVGLGGPSVPMDRLAGWAGEPLRYSCLTLALDSPSRTPEVETRIREMGLQAPGMDLARQVGAGVAWVRAALGTFGAALLLVAGMGIFTGLSLQVREEEATIGLYRALGASRRDIMALYLARAGLLGLAGSSAGLLAGLLAGAWLARGIAGLATGSAGTGLDLFQPGLPGALGAPAFGLVTSLAAGFLPARRAAGLAPAEALRR